MKKYLIMVFNPLISLKYSFHNYMHNLKLSYFLKNSKIGKNVKIMVKNEFKNPENISIGDHVYIGPSGKFFAQGSIEIKTGVIIGPQCTIYTSNHNYDSLEMKSVPYDNKVNSKKVTICDFVWIGGNVVIVPGVKIGKFAVIAAGAVITRDVPPYAVMGGNPAEILKFRKNRSKCDELAKQDKIYSKIKDNIST